MVKVDTAEVDGLKGGGNFLMPLVPLEEEPRGFGGGGATDFILDPRASGRGTATQSGSSVGVKGFDGRFGLGMNPFWGGARLDRAG